MATPTPMSTAVLVDVVRVNDPLELDTDSRMSRRLARVEGLYNYRLVDRSLLRQRFERPITSHLNWRLDGIALSEVRDRFATCTDILSDEHDWFCFSATTRGTTHFRQDGREATGTGAAGLAFRAGPGTSASFSDGCGRSNLWLEAAGLEAVLADGAGDALRRPLRFEPVIAWDRGLAASLRSQMLLLAAELARPDGLAGNAVALTSLRDLMMQTALRGLPNNHSDGLAGADRRGAVPAYVRRAEAFMRAQADAPLRIAAVAAAAGCSVRTLEGAFNRFRDTTPLRALRAIRLERARTEIEADAAPVADIARRFGFTNPARFAAAYRRRFGEAPRRARPPKPPSS